MKFLPLLFILCGCAGIKTVEQKFPQQSLDCLSAEVTVANGAAVAVCVAKGGGTGIVEACIEGLGEAKALEIAECEGLALWSDLNHAETVAVSNGIPTPTVQLNAQAYLVSKGVLVAGKAPTNPQ